MTDASYRLPDSRAASFDVRKWLADLGRCSAGDVHYVEETHRRGRMVVTYECAGHRATVRVAPMGGVAAAAWEVTAQFDGRIERVVVPGDTRFIWQTPRGTHG